MKQLSVALLAIAIALVPSLASAQQSLAKSAAAPADEYFGQMKMSILGIRNELKTLADRIDHDPAASETDIHTAELVEGSLEQWAVKYPKDSWLPDACTKLETVYGHVAALEGKLHLARFVMWMHAHLKDTPLEATARTQAAQLLSVPEHSADLAKTAPDAAESPSP
jgi:hypothetical protein